ncbi:MAG: hypothetical protein AVDCRST_MAG62-399, partial [uncultured Sphingomonas sp.]
DHQLSLFSPASLAGARRPRGLRPVACRSPRACRGLPEADRGGQVRFGGGTM